MEEAFLAGSPERASRSHSLQSFEDLSETEIDDPEGAAATC